MIDYKLTKFCKIVAIGGGHGLSQVLRSLSFLGSNLSGIVTTSDNGGSSGKLRKINKNIAWGDIRNCLSHLVSKENGDDFLNYRFKGQGGIAGHSLGNLIFNAMEQLGSTPLNAVNQIRNILSITHVIYVPSNNKYNYQSLRKFFS